MCITIVGRVVKVNCKKGIVEVGGRKREMNLALVDVKRGDYVSCSLGLAVEKLDREDATAILDARRGMLEGK